ncbi:protein SAWADEE HOMEODOMAIN HOMOLOG 2-like [Herrania umbratica]|uniref:Protein SAWADEE HOMEODOMAIN HOMOLOG 2-like n=1 Tax=Herrania umbratica TaxID=108875 RepID=A0A6J1AM73_9ROSI|nr:protein SAWADEE HOMEODOMAIN HOMOLOG 2-like [Herrania umbratica]
MGRPPSNGGPAFRFTPTEVAEMETILQEHQNQMPVREILVSLAEKFSESADRKGKIVVQFKQVWNWFQNRRYAIRAKSSKVPGKLNITSMPRDDVNPVRTVPQPIAAPMPPPMTAPMPVAMPASTVPGAGRPTSEHSYMEFEAKSSRDGAWYDVSTFLAHRYLDTGDPEVQVRFAGFGPEEDEWVNIRKHVRQRSLPCEASECVAVLPGDLILCFQVDFHLQLPSNDGIQEIVPLRKVCRRPETDYRLQQLHASNDSASTDQQKTSTDPSTATAPRVISSPTETMLKQQNPDASRTAPVSHANVSVAAQTTNPESKNTGTMTTNITNPVASNPGISPSGAVFASSIAVGTATGGFGQNMQEGK